MIRISIGINSMSEIADMPNSFEFFQHLSCSFLNFLFRRVKLAWIEVSLNNFALQLQNLLAGNSPVDLNYVVLKLKILVIFNGMLIYTSEWTNSLFIKCPPLQKMETGGESLPKKYLQIRNLEYFYLILISLQSLFFWVVWVCICGIVLEKAHQHAIQKLEELVLQLVLDRPRSQCIQ